MAIGRGIWQDGRLQIDEYRRQKQLLEDRLTSLVVPGVDAVREAGKLLEHLPGLWEQANLGERRQILLTMLDAVYVDAREDKAVVALRPKPAFKALFEIATTRKGSGIVLITTTPPNLPQANAERNSVPADFMLPCLQAKATGERSEWTRSFVRMVKAP